VLVDNSEFSFLANPGNGILIPDFIDNPNDCNLGLVWQILHSLEHEPDVRPVLKDMFELETFFASIGLHKR
jgi:hypothetical protein